MRVLLAPEAEAQINAIDAWWCENRTAAPNLFLEELAAAQQTICDAPQIGRKYHHDSVPGLRRFLLRSTRYHVYYTAGEATIVLLAVWSGLRGTGPDLRGLS